MAYEIKNGGEFIASINEAEFEGERLNNLRVLFGNVTKGCPCNRKKRRRHFEEAYKAVILTLSLEEKKELSFSLLTDNTDTDFTAVLRMDNYGQDFDPKSCISRPI